MSIRIGSRVRVATDEQGPLDRRGRVVYVLSSEIVQVILDGEAFGRYFRRAELAPEMYDAARSRSGPVTRPGATRSASPAGSVR